MTESQLKTPVALFLFNRPDTTMRVLDVIRQVKPLKLLLIADGPRADHPGEAEQCATARAVVDQVDWECEVLKNYADANLGCRQRLASGLDWVFATVDEAIILEDDCLPHLTFFRYCDELLEYYRDDERVMHISGDNFLFGHHRTPYSYYFSGHVHVWGWASWRRAWQHYDVTLRRWAELREGGWLWDLLGDPFQAAHWTWTFDRVARQAIDTWDYQWVFACWTQNGLSILPHVNLVRNIGFSPQGTRTRVRHPWSDLPTQAMEFPLRHPPHLIRDRRADQFTYWSQFSPRVLAARAANTIARGWRRG